MPELTGIDAEIKQAWPTRWAAAMSGNSDEECLNRLFGLRQQWLAAKAAEANPEVPGAFANDDAAD